ncbi:unnamed protein product [Paramecium octaurelia]|uniref:LysM domain-containing protein n=1 Tax=Paramecium octaurelia TaxID=43137 RepID=A0A8S1XU70_PAROT|nr:unnamed protein product [Paramecium octaurelia]
MKIIEQNSMVNNYTKQSFIDYEAEVDDSLYGMANQFNVFEDYIRRINFLANDLIFHAQIIKYPARMRICFHLFTSKNQRKNQNLYGTMRLIQSDTMQFIIITN